MKTKRLLSVVTVLAMLFAFVTTPGITVSAATSQKLAENLLWSMIANNQNRTDVYTNLNLLSSVTIDEQPVTLTWESSDADVIAIDGTVTRALETKNVTLTAAAGDASVCFDVIVPSALEGIKVWQGTYSDLTTYNTADGRNATISDSTEPGYAANNVLEITMNAGFAEISAEQKAAVDKNKNKVVGGYRFYYSDKVYEDKNGKHYILTYCSDNNTQLAYYYVTLDENGGIIKDENGFPVQDASVSYFNPKYFYSDLTPCTSDLAANPTIKTDTNSAGGSMTEGGMWTSTLSIYEKSSASGYGRLWNGLKISIGPLSSTEQNAFVAFPDRIGPSNVESERPVLIYGETEASASMVTKLIGKTADMAVTLENTDNLENMPMSTVDNWVDYSIKWDLNNNYARLFRDGKPVYWEITVDGAKRYTSIFTIKAASRPRFWISPNRNSAGVYGNYLVDNMTLKYVSRADQKSIIEQLTPPAKVDGLDIAEIPGAEKYFDQDFENEAINEGDRVTTDMGFATFDDTSALSNLRYYVTNCDIVSDIPSNKVMRGKPNITVARPTEQQFAEFNESSTTVTLNNAEYKVIDFIDGYYIAMRGSDRNTMLYWFNKSSVTEGALPAQPVMGRDYAPWFIVDENGRISNISTNAAGSSWKLPSPKEGVGSYAIQFDFAYPSNGNLRTGQEGFNLMIQDNEYHIRNNGLTRNGVHADTRSLDFGKEGTSLENTRTVAMVPKTSIDIPHYFLSTDDHSEMLRKLSPMYSDNSWHTFMVYLNLDEDYMTFYIDGLPLYALAANGGYSCRYKLDDTSADIIIQTNRYCVYNDNVPMFDNFLAYEVMGTDEEIAERAVKNIKLPIIDDFEVLTGDIIFDREESALVTWSFNNDTYIIDEENPLIARYNAPYGWGTSKVTLTATCEYGSAVKTRSFELTVKDKPKYTIDTVLMKADDGTRIYRPLNNSIIENISYTANSSETPSMFLAVYGADGSVISVKKGIPAENKMTFNQVINAGETYRVFVWEEGELVPLAETRVGNYIENETPTIYIIGDSIAQTYTNTATKVRGWGQYLNTAFNDNVSVVNKAMGGRTSKQVLVEDRVKFVLENIKPGDYLFIMLGHNDQNPNNSYCATPEEYETLLEEIALATKAKGATTVFLTSLPALSWGNNKQPNSNGEYVLYHTLTPYPDTMREVAEKTGMPIIDIYNLARAELIKMGPSRVAELEYYNSDSLHTLEAGAKWVVKMISDELKTMNLPISQYVK